MAKPLALNFSVPLRGILWNTLALPAKGILFLEMRDEARRRVAFSALQYKSGNFLWQDRSYTERWWVSLLAAGDDTLLLQRYNPDEPDMRSLVAVEAGTGQVRWARDEFSFEKISGARVHGHAGVENRTREALDLESGEIMDDNGEIDPKENKISGVVCPFLYRPGTPYFATVSEFLSTKFRHRPEGAVEYLEFNGKVVISYHIRTPDGLTNYLLVILTSGTPLLHVKMAEGTKGLGTDTFFVLSDCLFFVMNGELLLSYQLL